MGHLPRDSRPVHTVPHRTKLLTDRGTTESEQSEGEILVTQAITRKTHIQRPPDDTQAVPPELVLDGPACEDGTMERNV